MNEKTFSTKLSQILILEFSKKFDIITNRYQNFLKNHRTLSKNYT